MPGPQRLPLEMAGRNFKRPSWAWCSTAGNNPLMRKRTHYLEYNVPPFAACMSAVWANSKAVLAEWLFVIVCTVAALPILAN